MVIIQLKNFKACQFKEKFPTTGIQRDIVKKGVEIL